ncbi:hypothetical protein EWM64_g9499 [Hericium alpestre]|uniref:FCP1 homology domain-containing protein n=1 Tax=Hericium alpestre TaxID=135208 RepID=A0A4Y9ZKT4_9AGAM|nr:hypothetical protein EWM64_g9499 [Hericium alpestre]
MAPAPSNKEQPAQTPAAAPAKPPKHSLFARASKRKATKKGKAASSAAPAAEPEPQPNGTSSSSPETEQVVAQPQGSVAASTLGGVSVSASDPPKADEPKGESAAGGDKGAGPPTGLPGQDPPSSQPETASPAEQASAGPTTTTSDTTTAPPLTSVATPASAPADQPDEVDKEKEKDKGSLSTTLTGTQTHTRSAASRRDVKSSRQAKGKWFCPARVRVSFLTRLVHVLVPCVPSQSSPTDLDVTASQDPNSSAAALQEKQLPRDAEPESQPAHESPVSGESVSEHPEPSTSVVPPSQPKAEPELSPISTADSTPVAEKEVIVPPTPTKLLDESETAGLTSGAVQAPGSTGAGEITSLRNESSGDESDGTSFTEDEEAEEPGGVEEIEDEEDRLIMNGGAGIPIGPDGTPRPLLPVLTAQFAGRKCLVLDLDETLVHSSFKSIQQADYVVPVEIEYHWHNVYVIKRPGVDQFLKKMGEIYEIVVFTASLSKYADPVLDKLDIHHVVSHRLFRESCYNHRGNYVKDLSQLGRSTQDTIILDNSPASYIFHPNNAVPVSSWFNDPHDTELTDLCPFLADLASVDDVRGVLDGGL